eukprot:CAMPEP_0117438340 /NCGR_PEP_ID=MMETSP0759-20121206/2003_1 /TAXON_ID=63605 /ORGANISM="Percolomonas cosmopolitus, Strain WS" /LENGTH=1119 /DNA_ID=CAMNT_0005230029 /DNA_START=59 /DNA_END=3415 /DNA_ORIENTATION=+
MSSFPLPDLSLIDDKESLPNHVIETASLSLKEPIPSYPREHPHDFRSSIESPTHPHFQPSQIILSLSRLPIPRHVEFLSSFLENCIELFESEPHYIQSLFNWQWNEFYLTELFFLTNRIPFALLEQLRALLETSHNSKHAQNSDSNFLHCRWECLFHWMLQKKCCMHQIFFVLERFRETRGTSCASGIGLHTLTRRNHSFQGVIMTHEALNFFLFEDLYDFPDTDAKLNMDFRFLDECFFVRSFVLTDSSTQSKDIRIKWNRILLRYWEMILDDSLWFTCTASLSLTEDDRNNRLRQCAKSIDAYNQSLLHVSCARGILTPLVKFLVEQIRIPLNAEDEEGFTPLHHAVSCADSYELVKFLLFKGAKAKIHAKGGFSPLMTSCANGNEKAIFFLGNDQINHCTTECHTTALHVAAECGQLSALKKLIGSKSRKNTKNADGHTALGLALVNGHEDCASELIRGAKCKVDIEIPFHHASVSTLKFVWMFLRSEMLVRNLLEVYADGETFVSAIMGDWTCTESEDKDALNEIKNYLVNSWENVRTFLLQVSGDSQPSTPARTTLDLLDELYIHILGLDVGTLNYLVDHHGETRHDHLTYFTSPQDMLPGDVTVFLRSILDNNLEAVQLCFKKDALINYEDELTPLFVAIQFANEEILSLILENINLDLTWCDAHGNNALHVACDAVALEGRPIELVQRLIEKDCPFVPNTHGETPLILAALNGDLRVATLFLKEFFCRDLSEEISGGESDERSLKSQQQRPSINHKDSEGRSALWYAVFYGRQQLVSLLLSPEYGPAHITEEMLYLASLMHGDTTLTLSLFEYCTPRVLEDVGLCDRHTVNPAQSLTIAAFASVDEIDTTGALSISAWNSDSATRVEKACAPISREYFQLIASIAEKNPSHVIPLIVEFYSRSSIEQNQDALWEALRHHEPVVQNYYELRQLLDTFELSFASLFFATDYVHEKYHTLMHYCAKHNLVSMARYLLRLGFQLDSLMNDEILLVACRNDSLEFFLWFSKHGQGARSSRADDSLDSQMLVNILQTGSKRMLRHLIDNEPIERLNNLIQHAHLRAAARQAQTDICLMLYNSILCEDQRTTLIDKLLEYGRMECLKEIIHQNITQMTW